jgi:hypothetical protein
MVSRACLTTSTALKIIFLRICFEKCACFGLSTKAKNRIVLKANVAMSPYALFAVLLVRRGVDVKFENTGKAARRATAALPAGEGENVTQLRKAV